MIRLPTVMSVPFVLRNFDPRAERPGGFFSSLHHHFLGALTLGLARSRTRATGARFEWGFFGLVGGGALTAHWHCFHGNLQLGVSGTSRFLQLSFWVELQTVCPQLCQHVSHALSQHIQQG
jgi:hypothetical protein